ncbi:MAG: fibrobacter succinogenes major paralogous domain-containing protein [Bacteroidetes bacterium]|nr:fibrobacter succinogenes major paralogous domain-containing protein [Bacteroidota bacterium]
MKNVLLFTALLLVLLACNKNESNVPDTPAVVSDIDGNRYEIISIGGREWMKQNLSTSRYRNGAVIPNVTDPAQWDTLTTGAWCWYNNDSATYAATYGKLYNWYAVNDPGGLAPAGWHVPDAVEWTTLSTSLGGNAVAGGLLKESGNSHWMSPNSNATNSTGFTGLPSGFRDLHGPFSGITFSGIFWTSSPFDALNSNTCELMYNEQSLITGRWNKNMGYAVRCTRD